MNSFVLFVYLPFVVGKRSIEFLGVGRLVVLWMTAELICVAFLELFELISGSRRFVSAIFCQIIMCIKKIIKKKRKKRLKWIIFCEYLYCTSFSSRFFLFFFWQIRFSQKKIRVWQQKKNYRILLISLFKETQIITRNQSRVLFSVCFILLIKK